MSTAWDFFQRQLLGMAWLDVLAGRLVAAFGLNPGGKTGASLRFFLYDSVKIFVLLSTLIFIVSYIQSHFPPERTRRLIGRFHGMGANALAALLGTLTPFCSCSSIPLFIGFTNAGLPVGVTFSFLISSPLVDLGALILLVSVFGAPIAIAYVLSGLILAIIGGSLIDRLGMERHVVRYGSTRTAEEVRDADDADGQEDLPSRRERVVFAVAQVRETVGKVWPYVLVGVGIGALIHNWIPERWIETVLGADRPWSVLVATAVGIPMYADIFGTIPIAEALFAKGVGLGTILALMMAVTALSLPSMIMLGKVVKPKLLALFVGIVSAGIIGIGYAFNALAFLF